MRGLKLLVSLAALLALEARGAPPPVEAFGRIPQVDKVALSPNGKLIAWEDNSAERQSAVVFNLETANYQNTFSIDPNNRLRAIRWADDATLLIDVSATHTVRADRRYTYEWYRTLSADLATGKTKVLLMMDYDRQFVTGARLLAARTATPNVVTMSSWDYWIGKERQSIGTRLAGRRGDSAWVYSAFSVDTRTGRGNLLAVGSQFTDDWVVDATGQPVARADWEPEQRVYTVLAKDGTGWRKIHEQRDAGRLQPVGLSSDGRAVLAMGANGRKTTKLWSIPLDGSGAQALIDDPERDVLSVHDDPLTGAPLAVNLGGLSSETAWLDKQAEARHKAVARAFPGRDVLVVGRSEDGQRVVARVEGPSHPPVYYLVDFRVNRADIVGEAYPALADVKLGQVRGITYRARDGAPIPAYLTLPVGAAEKALPLVVLPHGGMEGRDYLKFDWWAQFLASRGYAVLQPQFRGSIGFGEGHRLAGRREWGGLMQDDITDGIKALIEQGIVDPRRVCITGAAFGGYAALAGAAFTPELYACAASVNGISDLPAIIAFEESMAGEEWDSAYYLRDHIGLKGEARIAEKSPARAAAAVKAPILLIHGVDDTMVPIWQSEQMERALTALHRPVKLVRLKGEDHWLSRSETRIRLLSELESFLSSHLAAPACARAATEATAVQD